MKVDDTVVLGKKNRRKEREDQEEKEMYRGTGGKEKEWKVRMREAKNR